MYRRQFITTTIVGIATAGCIGGGDGDAKNNNSTAGDDNATSTDVADTPTIETAIEEYIDAFDRGDYDALLAVCHSEGPEIETIRDVGEEKIEQIGKKNEFEILSMEKAGASSDSALMEVTYETTKSGESEINQAEIELKEEDDEWKIWNEH